MEPAARIYLDHNATAPLRPAARAAMLAALDGGGNASSVHAEGRAARACLSAARRHVAALVGADPRGVVFTAGATEAAALALAPGLVANDGAAVPVRLLAGATEHACVLHGHRFDAAEIVPVDADGVLDLKGLENALAHAQGPVMLALQAANNETGVLQPVRAAADRVHAAGGLLVCDAVQAVGRIPFTLAESGADALILSSHKLGGPQGAGALVLADPDAQIGAPLLRGGGQERGLRAGTENVAAIAGFGAACEDLIRTADEPLRLQQLRDEFEAALRSGVPDAVVLGAAASRLPNTSCLALPGLSAATILMALDLAGFAVSSGAACSSGKVGRSHVLDAMGVAPHMSACAIRVSFGWSSRAGDAAAVVAALRRIHERAGVSHHAA